MKIAPQPIEVSFLPAALVHENRKRPLVLLLFSNLRLRDAEGNAAWMHAESDVALCPSEFEFRADYTTDDVILFRSMGPASGRFFIPGRFVRLAWPL